MEEQTKEKWRYSSFEWDILAKEVQKQSNPQDIICCKETDFIRLETVDSSFKNEVWSWIIEIVVNVKENSAHAVHVLLGVEIIDAGVVRKVCLLGFAQHVVDLSPQAQQAQLIVPILSWKLRKQNTRISFDILFLPKKLVGQNLEQVGANRVVNVKEDGARAADVLRGVAIIDAGGAGQGGLVSAAHELVVLSNQA